MYLLASDVIGKPILSLQNGQALARVGSLLINPDDLELVAIFCDEGRRRKGQAVLLVRDVRDIVRDGVIIDSFEDIEEVGEIVRLQALVEKKFALEGIGVYTESKQKLGTVEDYTVDTTSYKVQKLYLKQSILKNLLLNNLVIDRTQIIDVSPKQITVRDASEKAASMATIPTEPA